MKNSTRLGIIGVSSFILPGLGTLIGAGIVAAAELPRVGRGIAKGAKAARRQGNKPQIENPAMVSAMAAPVQTPAPRLLPEQLIEKARQNRDLKLRIASQETDEAVRIAMSAEAELAYQERLRAITSTI